MIRSACWRRVLRAVVGIVVAGGVAVTMAGPSAQAGPGSARPFSLPFCSPPGIGTWVLGQPYGNTTRAYVQRKDMYVRSGGIHFGMDFSAPCRTEATAIADGIVFAVDNLNFGSPPHNLIIDYPAEGYSALYGHLSERPTLTAGQEVRRGEVVALTGDPDGTCCGRPHLHLEIRDLKHARKFNPATLIDADWDNLALISSFSGGYEYNLDNPRQWQHEEDQPEAVSAGAILNDFEKAWPPDWRSFFTR